MNALKSLINACIDESLIKQGIDQIMMNPHNDARRSGPTIIEKICVTIESLLDYHYAAVWDMAFQVVSTIFDKLGIPVAVSKFFCSSCALFEISILFPVVCIRNIACIEDHVI